jgi:hypothetical protein
MSDEKQETTDDIIGLCPMNKAKCRFWNDIFYVCSIAIKNEIKVKENTPCSRLAIKEGGAL